MSSEKPPPPPERRVSNEEKLGRSFQGQVMGSITQRLAREKAERERFAQERERTSGTRNYSVTFGEKPRCFGPNALLPRS